MNTDQNRQDSRLKNTAEKKDASPDKSADKLIEVKKRDNGEDKENKFLLHDKPFDEQMHQSFDDLRDDQRDEEAD
jgi:hypothetical protein